MKIRVLIPALAVLALAGCAHAAAPTALAPAASPSATPAATAATLTCKQQGAQWKATNKATTAAFKAALIPFTKGVVTSAQAKALSSSAQAMIAVPLPSCADPKGYYTTALANLSTAGQAAEGGGALAELGALAPLENALTALTELSAEMKQTIGSGKI